MRATGCSGSRVGAGEHRWSGTPTYRLSRHGVSVTTIKPGFVDTAMTKGMEKLFWLASPQAAAVQICDAAKNRRHTRYVFRRWGLIGFVVRSIPASSCAASRRSFFGGWIFESGTLDA